MDLTRSFQKTLYAVGYTESGRYITREKVIADKEESAIQSVFASSAIIGIVKLEEHYEPV